MEQKTIYYISEAAKKVQVESHVLRYWEEELQLPIKRNEMGHRYYTDQDVKQLHEIKALKEQGLQLKAIKSILKKDYSDISSTDINETGTSTEEKAMDYMLAKRQKFIVSLSEDNNKEEKAKRLQYLLQHMITESVKSANKELCTEIKESVLKELDYQFRARDEREEEHWKKEEEHYRKIDEMLRQHYRIKEKPPKKERKKRVKNKSGWNGNQT